MATEHPALRAIPFTFSRVRPSVLSIAVTTSATSSLRRCLNLLRFFRIIFSAIGMSFPMFRPIRKIMPWRVTLGLAQGSFCLLLHSHFILQFTIKKIIYVLEIPSDSFEFTEYPEKGKICLRKDKQYYMDLNINAKTFVDRKSSIDFSKFITNEIKY